MTAALLSAVKAAELLGCTRRNIALLCAQGRIVGAFKAKDGRAWLVPAPIQILPNLKDGRRKKCKP